MSATPNDLARLLSIDPLAEAERMTGKSYKDDNETMRLGMGLHMIHAETTERALKAAQDSHFSMGLADTLALYADMGFVEVLRDEFVGTTYSDEPCPAETFHILWRDGILVTVESYNTTGRNSTKAYYNVAIRDQSDMWSRTSSGRLTDDDVWVGDHDGRQGIRTNLARLAEVGDFLPVWREQPFLWLLNYAETKGEYDYAAINADRIGRLPAHVQYAIGGVTA